MENTKDKTRPGSVLNWGFEWKTKLTILGLPLVHIAIGRDSSTGKLLAAKGIIAIGQFAFGFIAIAQFGIGVLLGLGQFATGLFAVAQFALGIYFALGQFAVGFICIAQFGAGQYVLAQAGYGRYVWSATVRNLQALEYFKNLL